MTKTITTEIKNVDTEPMLDATALSLLLGVRPEEINALPVVDGTMRIPAGWMKRGKLRTKEASAATGSDFILDILQHWAQRDHNAELEVVYV